MSDHLFDPGPAEVPVQLSADRKRTLRQRAALADGRHPLMGGPLRTDGETCGSCEHHRMQGGVSGSYHKCVLRSTRGRATDIRVRWPGCVKWEAQS